MADVRENRIYCPEHIKVPEELPQILIRYSKAVIKANPANIVSFSAEYFKKELENKKENASKGGINELQKPSS
jgi:hypothetical protein